MKSQTERDNALMGRKVRALDRAEQRLVRAQNAWQKSRSAVRAHEKRMDSRDAIEHRRGLVDESVAGNIHTAGHPVGCLCQLCERLRLTDGRWE